MGTPTYRSALITGASSGIGAALARELAANGTHVVLSARRESELQQQSDAIQLAGGRAHVSVLDLKDPSKTEAAIAALDDEFEFDLVIANAGVGRLISGKDLSWEACEDTIAVNVAGVVATLLGALPNMVARGHGHLVGVSSIGQGMAMPRNATYLASKAFLSTFLASLRIDVQGTGVIVSDVRPGIVDTPMTESLAQRPFVISADAAASTIYRGLQQQTEVISFPRQARVMAAVMRMLPARAFRTMMQWIDKP